MDSNTHVGQDNLIGIEVTFRKDDKEATGWVTGLHWMPTSPGYNPHMVATIMTKEGSIQTMFLQNIKVTHPYQLMGQP